MTMCPYCVSAYEANQPKRVPSLEQVPVLPRICSSLKFRRYAAGGAILHGAGHAFSDFRNQRADIKLALYARLKADDLIDRRGVLEVIKRASVGDGGNQRAELQRRHGNAFTKRAHLAYAAETGVELMIGEGAEMLAFNAVTGKLTESKLVRVIADLGKAEAASDGLKISVVGMRQRLGKASCARVRRARWILPGNNFFTEAGQRHGNLDSGTGLRAFTERQLLVDHGKNASAGGINGDDGAVHVAQRINSGLAHHGIFTFNDVAVSNVVGK